MKKVKECDSHSLDLNNICIIEFAYLKEQFGVKIRRLLLTYRHIADTECALGQVFVSSFEPPFHSLLDGVNVLHFLNSQACCKND